MAAERPMLDLEQFPSLEDAAQRVEEVGRLYLEVGKYGLQRELTELTLFFMSALSRAQGLHDAVAREIRQANPHAVFLLLRAYAETSIMVLYVMDHPEYARALQGHPVDGSQPKRKSIQAIINYASRRFGGLKHVYADLSEIAHFGSIGMWAAMTPGRGEKRGSFTWTSYPRWRDERQALIACAGLLPAGTAGEIAVARPARET